MKRAFSSTVALALIVSAAPARAYGPVGPLPTIAVGSSLTGSVRVTFDRAVRGVSQQNVVLRVSGRSSNVARAMSCTNALGGAADCVMGPVAEVVLSPGPALLAGQSYDVIVNPAGVDSLTSMDGVPARRATKTFNASTTEQETSAGARFSWRGVAASKAFGGSYRTERIGGARATVDFVGTSVTWYTRKSPAQGTATVYIDGAKAASVNNYASTASWKVARRIGGLSKAAHRITVVVDGKRGSSRGTGTFITIDAWAVNGTIVKSPGAVYRWDSVTDSVAAGDHYVRANLTGARATFTFLGNGIDWYTITGPNQGKARVLIDGVARRTYDNYSPTVHHGVRRWITGLSHAVHTITIEVLGTRNAASSGTSVIVDSWVVRLPSAASFRRLGAWVDLYDYSLDPADAVAAMASRGVKALYLETARYNSDGAFVYPSKVAQWIEAAHAKGIKVIGWYLPAYSEYLDVDVARTIAIATYRTSKHQGFDAVAIDIEYKAKTSSSEEFNTGITSHLARVRAGVGTIFPVGAIVPAPMGMAISPSNWIGFPWSSIGRYADVVLPMGYWSYRTDCSTNQKHCPYEYTRANIAKARGYTGLRVHVIGGIGNEVTTSEVADFVEGARDEHAYGGSLYDYRTTSTSAWTPLGDLNAL